MAINQVVVLALVSGIAVGVVLGLLFLACDRRREKRINILNIKDGITLK